jgi:predicted RNase H-like HicB family nuclease
MKIKVIVHEDDDGGYWAEVPGCATQGDTFPELLQNLYEAIEGCLEARAEKVIQENSGRIIEIAV